MNLQLISFVTSVYLWQFVSYFIDRKQTVRF